MRIKTLLQTVLLTLLAVGTTALSAQAGQVKWTQGGKEVYLVKKADNFIILYDSSGSMEEKYPGTYMHQLQAVRKILLEKNATLPDMNWQAGIYSFTEGKKLQNLIPYYPMQQYDKKKFSWTLLKDLPLKPTGPTMLQPGLVELRNILATLSGKTIVFLFNDGQYSPVNSLPAPGAQAARLAAEFDVCFVIINTSTTKNDFAELRKIASVNSCSYMVYVGDLLGNPEWMTNALFDVVAAPPVAKDVIPGYVWDNIQFDFDKSVIRTGDYRKLAEVATFLREYPNARIVLEGHTCSIGSHAYNLKLSHRRADSVRRYLVEKEGISAERITLSGFSSDRPIASVTLTPTDSTLYLDKLATSPTHRQEGLARELLTLAENRAQALNLSSITLNTRVELVDNHATFHAMGFEYVGEATHKGFDHPTSLIYRKTL
ncbi:MAG: hypothetical protein CR984_04550 [Proteobacteria bacterium]|nr:MAG: hypothetical protein CR984_04550 [Pseudomonadota bacterium]